MFQRSPLSREQALQKARHYCGYQFRCHQEVKEKLYSFGLRRQDVEEALATLVEDDYGQTLGKLAAAKWVTLKGETDFARRGKLQEYLVRKGYEQDAIGGIIKRLSSVS